MSPKDPLRSTVLLSGGLDSALVVSMLKERGVAVSAIFIDYGQAARASERRASSEVAKHYGIPWKALELVGARQRGAGEIPHRNDMLVSLALSEATGSVALGIHAGSGYVDCSPEWVDSWNSMIETQSSGERVLLAPLVNLEKGDVVALASKLGVPAATTFSCEAGNKACGVCNSCRDREAFHVGS